MRIKTLGLAFAVLVFASGTIAAVALMMITDFLAETSETLEHSVESVYVAEELEIALILHSRDYFLAALSGDQEYVASARERERQIGTLLDDARQLVGDSEEAMRFELTEQRVEAYLADRRRITEAKLAPLEAYRQAGLTLRPAYEATEELVRINRDQASDTQREAAVQSDFADRLGIWTIAAMLFLVAVMVVTGHQFVLKPLIALRESVSAFGERDFKGRAVASGPREVVEIALGFNEMAARLDRLRDSQIRFIASIAHDLRNPLGAIKMSADLLQSEEELDPAERNQMLEIIGRQTARLDMMVGDLLEVAKAEGGRLAIRPSTQDLRSLIRDSARLYENVSPAHKVVVRQPDVPVHCHCDPDRMSQVLNNLLSNAIKYTPYGGTVTVECEAAGDQVEVAVKDEGIGIDKEDLTRIFEPFRRSKATQDTIPGVGLGLATSRKIVEMHGGKIAVDSEKGKGSTFRVVLPAST